MTPIPNIPGVLQVDQRWCSLIESEPSYRLLYVAGAPVDAALEWVQAAGEYGGGAGTVDDGALVIVLPGSAPAEVFAQLVAAVAERSPSHGLARIELQEATRSAAAFQAALHRARLAAWNGSPKVADDPLRAIDDALREGWITTVFQPIVRAEGGALTGYEALVRGSRGALRGAREILQTALVADRMADLSARIRVCAARGIDAAEGEALLFLNLHPLDLFDPGFVERDALRGPLARIADRVVLEVSERTAIDSLEEVCRRITLLRGHGYRVAVDDLGSGYAGLTSLVALEPEFIKLDMGLVRRVVRSSHTRDLLSALSTFARNVGTQVVAEGVETKAEARALIELGCDHLQGHWIGRPAPACVAPSTPELGSAARWRRSA